MKVNPVWLEPWYNLSPGDTVYVLWWDCRSAKKLTITEIGIIGKNTLRVKFDKQYAGSGWKTIDFVPTRGYDASKSKEFRSYTFELSKDVVLEKLRERENELLSNYYNIYEEREQLLESLKPGDTGYRSASISLGNIGKMILRTENDYRKVYESIS